MTSPEKTEQSKSADMEELAGQIGQKIMDKCKSKNLLPFSESHLQDIWEIIRDTVQAEMHVYALSELEAVKAEVEKLAHSARMGELSAYADMLKSLDQHINKIKGPN
jgi:hypothetical protein